ncbi:MAG: malonyl-CoA decarboxylase family protein [Candidatus Margulisbacteria bacterium]|nr:malonyl-CoA decarboxylase family protein [Candidatus Margulisiibacteriota bacterium]
MRKIITLLTTNPKNIPDLLNKINTNSFILCVIKLLSLETINNSLTRQILFGIYGMLYENKSLSSLNNMDKLFKAIKSIIDYGINAPKVEITTAKWETLSAEDKWQLARIEKVIPVNDVEELKLRFPSDKFNDRDVFIIRFDNEIVASVYVAYFDKKVTSIKHILDPEAHHIDKEDALIAYFYSINNSSKTRKIQIQQIFINNKLELLEKPLSVGSGLIKLANSNLTMTDPHIVYRITYSPFKGIRPDGVYGFKQFFNDYIKTFSCQHLINKFRVQIPVESILQTWEKIYQLELPSEVPIHKIFAENAWLTNVFENLNNLAYNAQSLVFKAFSDSDQIRKVLTGKVPSKMAEYIVELWEKSSKKTIITSKEINEIKAFYKRAKGNEQFDDINDILLDMINWKPDVLSVFAEHPLIADTIFKEKLLPLMTYLAKIFQNDERYLVGLFHRKNGARNADINFSSNPEDLDSLGANINFDYTNVKLNANH